MKKLILFVVLLNVFSIIPSFSQLRVMTYNIRLNVQSDGPDNWEHRKDDIIKYVEELQPDFLGIQEGMPGQVDYLDDLLESYSYIGDGREGPGQGEYSAIFYDKTKWEIMESDMFWLSETPEKVSMGWDAACHRVCTFGVFENKNAFQIAVFNTHFDHVGQKARKQSAQMILDRIATYSESFPVVLMGDFNIEPDNEVYALLSSALQDSGKRFSEYTSKHGTFNGFKLKDYAEQRIDYIFINEKLSLQSFKIDRPLTKNGRQLSDHFPVITDLK